MGVGTNILGYSHPEVDASVQEVILNGNMSTLNAPEEVYLAERLIDMHQFAEMAKFCRSGGEANAVAIRIVEPPRRDAVAFCGYHGWHDWYLATICARKTDCATIFYQGYPRLECPIASQTQYFHSNTTISSNLKH